MNFSSKHKLLRNGVTGTFFLIHFVFLFFILLESKAPSYILVLIGILLCTTLFSYLRSPLHAEGFNYFSWRLVVWVPVGGLIAFYLNQKLGLGPVLGGSVTGFAASCIPRIDRRSEYLSHLPDMLYCGAFIGMSAPKVTHEVSFILIASAVTAVLLMFSKNLLHGVGGKLGTLAFMGVVAASVIYQLMNLWKLWY
ncbi:hypothetical protein [Sinomicrobium soli]|uniref:hypothetical protein n=1 Tax=Sinomicrobium sp. N-1-3-6 TaxID=2219864 RepID=UPI0011BE708F|nr:hypothetical protein [Sinomicrobium sp. N-1-3-6]